MNHRNRTAKLLIAVASLSLVAAACGSDDNDSASTDAPEPVATEAMEEEMSETTEEMEEEMTETTEAPEEAMDEEMAETEPSGPLCSAVPADGEGSFSHMPTSSFFHTPILASW